jgi:hypothetical protein
MESFFCAEKSYFSSKKGGDGDAKNSSRETFEGLPEADHYPLNSTTKEQTRRRQMKHTRKKSNGMKKHMLLLPVFLVAVVALILGALAPQVSAWGGKYRWYRESVEFAETAIFFEYNSTDQDLGLHIFWDAEGWEEVEVKDRRGVEIFEVENGGGLNEIGSTEVFTESAEPSLCPDDVEEDDCDVDAAIEEFQNKFLEGRYIFRGRTVDGKRLRGSATLEYDLPTPVDLMLNDFPDEDWETIEWTDTSEPGDEEIVGYEVVTEMVVEASEERVFVNTATFPASVTSFIVSPQFATLAVDSLAAEELVELKVEVIAIGENGNKTITEEALFEADEEE